MIFAVTLFAIGSTITLLFNSAPSSGSLVAYFFLSLFTSLFGLSFFILLIWNFFKYRGVPAWQSTINSARWSVLLAGFLTLALVLKSFRLWNIATGLVLLVGFGVLDLLWRRRFQLKKSQNSRE